MGAVLSFYSQLETTGPCPTCGVEFAIPSNMIKTLRENKKTFYCPSGHTQTYARSRTDELEAELKREIDLRTQAEAALAAQRKRREDAELQTRLTQGKLSAIRTRVKNGVCPCCHRSFVQLARHMSTKHPNYTAAGNVNGT